LFVGELDEPAQRIDEPHLVHGSRAQGHPEGASDPAPHPVPSVAALVRVVAVAAAVVLVVALAVSVVRVVLSVVVAPLPLVAVIVEVVGRSAAPPRTAT
jgi:hypothetical protein